MRVLVTGGAGYIGSHVVRQLGEAGHEVVSYDNLSTGYSSALLCGSFVEADIADTEMLNQTLARGFDAIMHFAASTIVPESVANPLKYYKNNTANTLKLLQACQRFAVGKFILSSTAAVYGTPHTSPVGEDAPLFPSNPYGASKMMSERMLTDFAATNNLKYVILRYFNVAGADLEARIGQASPHATNLIKVACEAAAGKREHVAIFGTDYPTKDGTGVRDYIHVEDLARAHLDALRYLSFSGESSVFNCGYGHGYSVKEVLDVVREVSGRPLTIKNSERRAGDISEMVAKAYRIRDVLQWQACFDDLYCIVKTAWQWEQQLAAGVLK